MTTNNSKSPRSAEAPERGKRPDPKATGKRIGKSKPAKANNKLNRRIK